MATTTTRVITVFEAWSCPLRNHEHGHGHSVHYCCVDVGIICEDKEPPAECILRKKRVQIMLGESNG